MSLDSPSGLVQDNLYKKKEQMSLVKIVKILVGKIKQINKLNNVLKIGAHNQEIKIVLKS